MTGADCENVNTREMPDYPNCNPCTDAIVEPAKPKKSKKKIIFLIVSLGLAVIIALCCVWFFGGSENKKDTGGPDALFYSGDSLYFYDTEASKCYLLEDNIDEDEAAMYDYWDVYITEDKSEIYYLEKHKSDNEEEYPPACDFIVFDTDGQSGHEVIDNSVLYFDVIDEAAAVIYEKEDGLYEYNIKSGETERVDKAKEEDSHDGYFWEYIGDSSYAFVNPSGNLYLKEIGGDRNKIDTDVDGEIIYTEDGKFIYTVITDDDESLRYFDYVDFDIDENDSDYDDELAQDLYDEFSLDTYELFYYDGKDRIKLSDCGSVAYMLENGDFIWYDQDFDTEKKIKFSQIEYIWDVKDFAQDYFHKSWHCMKNGEIYDFELEEGASIEWVSENFDEIRYIVPKPGKDSGDLFAVSFKNGEVSKAERVDSAVYKYSVYEVNGKSFYTVECSSGDDNSDYIHGGKVIAKDASDLAMNQNGDYIYLTDVKYDEDGNCTSTLMANIGGKETEIVSGTDVGFDYSHIFNDGSVCYMTADDDEAVFWHYCDGKSEKLATYDFSEVKNQLVYTQAESGDEYYTIVHYIAGGDLYRISGCNPELVMENVDYVWFYDLELESDEED